MKKVCNILAGLLIPIMFISCSSKASVVNLAANKATIANDKAQDIKEDISKQSVQASTIETPIAETTTSKEPLEAKIPVNDSKASDKKEQSKEIKKSKVIVLDPGHANKSNLEKEPAAPNSKVFKIKDGGGAQGIATRTPEYKINMEVALRLKELLEVKGYTVVMTKTDNSLSLGNVERAEIWNKANADLAVRIHADSVNEGSVRGASMLIPSAANEYTKPIYKNSKEYGKIILDTLIAQVGMRSRGLIESNDMTGFNWSKVPVILVEMGFLSNVEEDRLLSSKEYQEKICKALADGIALAVK
jgi:N-acetylmuramoyl-L-alanine amidase